MASTASSRFGTSPPRELRRVATLFTFTLSWAATAGFIPPPQAIVMGQDPINGWVTDPALPSQQLAQLERRAAPRGAAGVHSRPQRPEPPGGRRALPASGLASRRRTRLDSAHPEVVERAE